MTLTYGAAGMLRHRASIGLLSTALLSVGCPAEVSHVAPEPGPKAEPQVGADDPRVHADGEDLYPATVMQRAQEKQGDFADTPGLGSGRPDESNGVCRLYAPKLPQPECCKTEYGFDVDTVRKACGRDLYLGESWQFSCGYYFHLPDGHDTWFRTSFVPGETTKQAAEAHAKDISRRLSEDIQAKPLQGVPDAWEVSREEMHWTFLPGWESVRLLTWKDTACSAQGIAQVAKAMIDAKQPEKGAKRLGLLPKAR